MPRKERIVNRKKSWSFIKDKVNNENLKLDYEEKLYGFQAFVVQNSTRFFTNLYDLNFRRVVGRSATNETDYDDFVNNYKKVPDQSPPEHGFPLSSLDNRKLAVHTSYKPIVPGTKSYALWSGAGDDTSDPNNIGGGDILHFSCVPGTTHVSKQIKFNWQNCGRVWIHEGYLRFENAGNGDYMSSQIIAEATPLQQLANLDLELDGNRVRMATGGPGTGTHGFFDANRIQLIPRSYSKDGYWDYNEDTQILSPNASGTGLYDIYQTDKAIHQFFNKIPVCGSCPYFSMTSDETTELLTNYYIEITAHNVSDSTWNASIIMELYRERTLEP